MHWDSAVEGYTLHEQSSWKIEGAMVRMNGKDDLTRILDSQLEEIESLPFYDTIESFTLPFRLQAKPPKNTVIVWHFSNHRLNDIREGTRATREPCPCTALKLGLPPRKSFPRLSSLRAYDYRPRLLTHPQTGSLGQRWCDVMVFRTMRLLKKTGVYMSPTFALGI